MLYKFELKETIRLECKQNLYKYPMFLLKWGVKPKTQKGTQMSKLRNMQAGRKWVMSDVLNDHIVGVSYNWQFIY